jgi:predicted dehydrogenase
MSKVKWGVLGAANIGLEKVLPAMQSSQFCDVVALAPRDLSKVAKSCGKVSVTVHFV